MPGQSSKLKGSWGPKVCPPPAQWLLLHCGTTVCSADKALETTVPSGPGSEHNLPCFGVYSCGSPLAPCPWREQLSLLPLKAQLPPKGRSRQPCTGSGFGSTVAKKVYLYQLPKSKGIMSNHLTGAHEAPPTFQLHISLCLSPARTFLFTPLQPNPASDTTPHCQGWVGGPSLCALFACLCLLLDVSSERPTGLWGCGPSTKPLVGSINI